MLHGYLMKYISTWIVTSASKMFDFGLRESKAYCGQPTASGGVTVWCALSCVRIFSSVFVDGTFTSDIYISLLNDEFASFLMGYGIPVNAAWFEQDGISPHTSNAVLCFMMFSRRESC
jgi:hypothetical protein